MGQLGTQTFTFSKVARAKAPVVTDSVGYGCLYMMSLKVQIIFILNCAQLITLFIYLSIVEASNCENYPRNYHQFHEHEVLVLQFSFKCYFYIKYLHIPPILINFFII